MSELTAVEQLMLEMVNRARLDPLGEAARYGIGLNDGLAAGTLDGSAKQALSPNAFLAAAAHGHSQWMLDNDIFSHTGVGGSNSRTRMENAGYDFSQPGGTASGENISWRGTSLTPDLEAFIKVQHERLFESSGHRRNLLNDSYRELGIAQVEGTFPYQGWELNTSMVTQNFAKAGTAFFVTGVVYDDLDGDDFYSVGEGAGGHAVTVDGMSGATAVAGGYGIGSTNGSVTVRFGTGATAVEADVDISAANAKVDFVDGARLLTSADLTLGANALRAEALGVGHIDITGNGSDNTLIGNSGANALAGGGGQDHLEGGQGNDVLRGDGGQDTIEGGSGNDSVDGGAEADLVRAGTGADSVDGGTGNDALHGEGGIDSLRGGAGADSLYGGADGDILNGEDGADFIDGGAGNDVIEGGGDSDFVLAGDGADTVGGGTENDALFGDAGNDSISGGDGADTLYGGSDDDAFAGGGGGDMIFAGTGSDTLDGEAGADALFGGAGDDSLSGGVGDDRLRGDDGADSLHGGDGADRLAGGAGDDLLRGGEGNDQLSGDAGADDLDGGAGADLFLFADGFGQDTVSGFGADEGDLLSLTHVSGADGYGDLLAEHATDTAAGVLISFGADTILLSEVSLADLETSDFAFAAVSIA